jgi:predicted ATPase/DNA-binding winged helix-turn-helix (wHTH) protein
MNSTADHAISFGSFRLLPGRQLLLEGDKPLRLGSRALDILIVLIERPGDLVTKEELFARVWPDTTVEEGNLRVHMAALRKALGDGQAGNRYVSTVPGRGYRFVAPISLFETTLDEPPIAPASAHNLPALLTRLVGRTKTVEILVGQAQERRLITIAGPGGIGKTAVALAVADELSTHFRGSVRLVDFAPLSDPALAPSALASVLGAPVRSGDIVSGLITLLKDKEILLVLDSCEHVIDTAAALSAEILIGAPGIHILATSREPLRVNGERVHRLLPLEVPASSSGLSATQALAFSAIQLFVERATADLDGFELNDTDAPIIADICRRLDGMPLAIELAAGCVDAFGIAGVAARLDDRFHLLTRGRRTALPRHQTLSATLNWSYELLPESERVILRRLAVLAGWFTMQAVSAIASGKEVAQSEVVDQVANLAAKSLVAVDVGGATVHYRLLESTRAYAFDKLKESGESELFARRHAEYFRDLFERAESERITRPAAEWLAAYVRQIDNVRTALDWAFSPHGDPALGIALTVASVPLWRLMSLMAECRSRAQRALVSLEPIAQPDLQAMKLLAALGAALRYGRDPDSEMEDTWTRVLAIAEQLDDVDYQLRALSGIRNVRLSDGRLRDSLVLARRFKDVAAKASDPRDVLVGDRMIGYGLHFLGDLADARRHTESMLNNYGSSVQRSHIIRFGYDQRVLAFHVLAETLWLQGLPDQAVRVTERNLDHARSIDHALSLCNALGQCACPIALFVGDLAAAERYVAMLLDHSAKNVLPLWHATGRCFDGVQRIKQGSTAAGVNILRNGLIELLETRFVTRYVAFLAELAEAYSHAGEIANAKTTIDEALERCRRNEELWYIAELARIRGEIELRKDIPNAATTAESFFQESLDWARRQNALSWELRTATSLARLWRSQGRLGDAHRQLAQVYARFTEGFQTADVIAARELLNEVS